MRASTGERLGEAWRAFAQVFRNPNLRRVELAWAGSVTGQWAYSIAIAVYAYEQGGAAAVGLVAVLRTIPAAIVSPFAAVLGDRLPRERVMLAADLARAGLLGGAAAVALVDGPSYAVYALITVSAMTTMLFHPAQAALLPSLARSPEELTAANVSSSTIESVGSFVGPAIGGLLLAATSAGVAFAFTAGAFLWSALMVARLRPEPAGRERAAAEGSSIRRQALAGFRTLWREPKLRLIVGLYSAQTIVAGAASVLIVVTALDLLGLGNSGVGYLNAASGIGGLVGAAVALLLVGRRRMAGDFGIGIVLWGAPLVLVGLWPNPGFALAMLGVLGLGNTLVDVAAMTLLQRSVPDEVLARVFGVMSSLLVATMGLGAILAPVLIAWIGARGALIVAGAFLPALAALLWTRLAAVDRATEAPQRQLELLRGIAMFAPLPAKTLDRLAHALRPERVEAGVDVVREGEAGDRYYIVDAGEAEVLGRRLGPGDYFGEIALLRDVPRTATVTARTALSLYALDRDEFLAAVTGHAPSRAAADAVVGERLGVPASA
ncbi:MAG TPA: MFS transporter [Gaiellaceae bacterium]|nr:MFS transporter [Gaiellaceae bacterium]